MEETKPKKTIGTINLSITNLDLFKDTIEIIIDLVGDKRIDEDIRKDYYGKLIKVISPEDYHIEM